MRALAILSISLLAAGCGATPEIYQPPAAPTTWPMHEATSQATKDCGGAYVSWSRITSRSLFPYRVDVTEWMRCLTDGRIVGPYSYAGDGL